MTKKEKEVLDELQTTVEGYYPKLKEKLLSSAPAMLIKDERNSLGQTVIECVCPFCGGAFEPSSIYNTTQCPHCGTEIERCAKPSDWYYLNMRIALTFDVPSLKGSFGFAFTQLKGKPEYNAQNIVSLPRPEYIVRILGVMTPEKLYMFALNRSGEMVPSNAKFKNAGRYSYYDGNILNYSTGNTLGINVSGYKELKRAVDNFVPPAPQAKQKRAPAKVQTRSFTPTFRKPEDVAPFVFDVYSEDSVGQTAEINAQCNSCGTIFDAVVPHESYSVYNIKCPHCGAKASLQQHQSTIITEIQDDGDNYNVIRYICRFDQTWQLLTTGQEQFEAFTVDKTTGDISVYRFDPNIDAYKKVKVQKQTLWNDEEKIIVPPSLKDARIDEFTELRHADKQSVIAWYLSILIKHPTVVSLIQDDAVWKIVQNELVYPNSYGLNYSGKTKAELFNIPEDLLYLADKYDIRQIFNVLLRQPGISPDTIEFLLKNDMALTWLNEINENGIGTDEFIKFAKTATVTQAISFNDLARAYSLYIKFLKEFGDDLTDPNIKFPEHFRETYARTFYRRNGKYTA